MKTLKSILPVPLLYEKSRIILPFSSILTSELKTYKDFIEGADRILSNMASINSKGYLNKPVNIPVVDGLLNELKLTKTIDLKLNKTVYDFIIFTLYSVSVYLVEKGSEMLEVDTLADLKTIMNKLDFNLSASIKSQIRKQGIQIIQNTYLGFDTEYELKSSSKFINQLLSVQLAGNVGMYVIVPKQDICLGYVNPQTSDITVKKVSCGRVDNKLNSSVELFEQSIIEGIRVFRKMFLNDHDKAIAKLHEGFKSLKLTSSQTQNSVTYSFPLSNTEKLIKYLSVYSIESLIQDSSTLVDNTIQANSIKIFELIKDFLERTKNLKTVEPFLKRSSRINFGYGDGSTLSVTTKRNLYICCHVTSADLSVLSDFVTFKEKLDIVNKCFVTRGLPLKEDHWVANVYIRDTILLAPAGKKSLDAVGSIYGPEYRKKDIGSYRGGNMKQLLLENEKLFSEYAMQDSIITLKHVNEMSNFYFKFGKVGVPLTLSALSVRYVENSWMAESYPGYQIRPDYYLGNVGKISTPKGLHSIGDVGLSLNYYVSSYRGGRNESFMYGVDLKKVWYDYDLVSAYTTSMASLGDPDYQNQQILFTSTLDKLEEKAFFNNYIALKVEFSFPKDTKYPCIPCSIDASTTIYPLQGKSVITGMEYLAAKKMGCVFKNIVGVLVPFSKNTKPYYSIIRNLQSLRRDNPKGSFLNLMWKEISNSIYGQVSKGISNKQTFDIKSRGMIEIKGGSLSNPLMASYITGFIRCVIGECLENVNRLDGSVISVTTDGFITDIENLESKLLELPGHQTIFLRKYIDLVKELSTGLLNTCLELKNTETEGIISWTTRGQLGVGSTGLKATTGFQTQNISRSLLVEEFIRTLEQSDKKFDFIQQSLRAANEIYKKGGHVVMVYKDRMFKLAYDNKRQIIEVDGIDPSKNLLTTKPWTKGEESLKVRGLIKVVASNEYSRTMSKTISKTYKNYLEVGVRAFIKGYLLDQPLYGLRKNDFGNYTDLINFVKGYEPCSNMSISKQSISNLKNRRMIIKNVPRLKEIEGFASYVKSILPDFKIDEFFK